MYPNYKDSMRADMAKLLPCEYNRVLEIGCAQGSFSENMNKAKEIWGVELNPESAAHAAKKLDRVLVGDYFSVATQLPNRYFDLVICNDVIEHIADHMSFLQSLSHKITDDGRFLISIPNVRCLAVLFEIIVRRDFRYRSSGVLDYTHVRFFTRKSIIRSLAESGFVTDVIIGKSAYSNSFLKRTTSTLIGVLTFGFFSDVGYVQFLIRALKLPNQNLNIQPPCPLNDTKKCFCK